MKNRKSEYACIRENKTIVILQQDVPEQLDTFKVLVKTVACEISIIKDDELSQELMQELCTDPAPLGRDLTGTVEKVGAGVKSLRAGDFVAGVIPSSSRQSACAEYVILEEFDLIRIPDDLNPQVTAACIGDCVRAYIALFYNSKITEDDVILVLNGATSNGDVCMQLAHYIGCKIIATCWSRDEKAQLETYANRYVDQIIDLSSSEDKASILYHECMKKTDYLGVDVILDLDKTDARKSLSHDSIISCLTINGRWISRNGEIQLDPPDSKLLFERCATLSFVNEQAWLQSKIAQGKYQHILQDIIKKLEDNIIRPYPYRVVSFQTLPDTMLQLCTENVTKVVVSIK